MFCSVNLQPNGNLADVLMTTLQLAVRADVLWMGYYLALQFADIQKERCSRKDATFSCHSVTCQVLLFYYL